MISKFSKKHKIIIAGSIATTLILYVWISSAQGKNRLIKQLELGDSSLKIKAATEMAEYSFGTSSLIDALGKAINDYDEDVRRTAINSLVRLDRNEAVRIFKSSLNSPDDGIRMDVTEALESIGSRSALATLDKAEDRTNRRYERARMKGVVNQMRNEYSKEKEKKYKRHRRAYGS